MQVREVMNKRPIKVKKSAYIIDIIKLFRDKRIHAAPVCDGDKLLGVVSEKDILDFMEIHDFETKLWLPAPFDFIEAVLDAKAEVKEIQDDFNKLKKATASDIMGDYPTVVSPDDHVSKVADIMSEYKETLVPVVEKKKLVGIVTRSDLIRAIA
jgi:CBS domain-containing protein